jgi:hypothetical protein
MDRWSLAIGDEMLESVRAAITSVLGLSMPLGVRWRPWSTSAALRVSRVLDVLSE